MIREITRRIAYKFPVSSLPSPVLPFETFNLGIPDWILDKNPTFSVLLEDLQLKTFLPSLPLITPLVFKGSESDSQIGAAVLEQKKKNTVSNGRAIEFSLQVEMPHPTDNSRVWHEIAKDYAYNLGFWKYMSLKTPYLATADEALVGFNISDVLGIQITTYGPLNPERDEIVVSGWYRIAIMFDDLREASITGIETKLNTLETKIDNMTTLLNQPPTQQPQSVTLNQPLTTTQPAPTNIILPANQIVEIIPASTVARRTIIKAVSGETKLLLGTSENIANSAISISDGNLIEERWQGAVFAWSLEGAELLINIEVA